MSNNSSDTSARKSTYQHIIEKLNADGALHFSVIDPDPIRQSAEQACTMAQLAEQAGTDAILVGGSTVSDQGYVDRSIELMKKTIKIPVIIFPGGAANVSPRADAILFMSILNSANHHFFMGQQALGAFMIKKAGLEHISMGYLIVEPGGAAGWISDAKLLPRNKPELTAVYSLAAEMFGFKMVYLEAGSGGNSIPLDIVKLTSRLIKVPLLIGGGVQNRDDARKFIEAGANIIVMGSYLENTIMKDQGASLKIIIDEIKAAGKEFGSKKFNV